MDVPIAEPALSPDERAAFARGVREFNDGFFFECHDTLEDLWSGLRGPARDFLQGLIQVSVAFYHLSGGNRPGAESMLERALRRLRKYPPAYGGLELEPHRAELRHCLARLRAGEEAAAIAPPKWRGDPAGFEGQWGRGEVMEGIPGIVEVRVEAAIPARIRRAFKLFARDARRWWPRAALRLPRSTRFLLEPKAGGRAYEYGGRGHVALWYHVTVLDTPDRLELVGPLPEGRGGPGTSHVRVAFEARDADTLVRVTEVLVGPRAEAGRVEAEARWREVLAALVRHAAERKAPSRKRGAPAPPAG
jgi:predicted metal-dependent hydrolase